MSGTAEELRLAKRRLDDGMSVSLGIDESFMSCSDGNDNSPQPRDAADGSLPEFELTSSSVRSELRAILGELNEGDESPGWNSEDPDVTDFILGLVGDSTDQFSNPFQLTENIRKEIIQRAEQAGSRALMWNMSTYDKVGGRGTIRSVWNKLKTNHLVKGQKRKLSELSQSSDDGDESFKKLKASLNISDTCERISNIELSGEEDVSIVLSEGEGDSRVFEDDIEINILHEEDGVPRDVIGDSTSISGDEWWNISGSDSMPLLASPDQLTSDTGDSDSGVIEEVGGGVTNLCRSRVPHKVVSGVITETGPFIPVSLGFSMSSGDSSWEEVVDEDGNPTGMERKSFRLNVIDGRKESVDEELDYIRRLNGIPDGVNTRRMAGVDHDPSEQYYADVSDDECSLPDIESQNDERNFSAQLGCSRATLRPSGQNDEMDFSSQSGCSRATLRPNGQNDERNFLSQLGCSRATLRPSGQVDEMDFSGQSGCSRATLRYADGGDREGEQSCSRATLRNTEGRVGYLDHGGCSRVTLLESYGERGESLQVGSWENYIDDSVRNPNAMDDNMDNNVGQQNTLRVWNWWIMVLSWWVMCQSCAWMLLWILHMVFIEHIDLTRERAVYGTTQDGGNWVVQLPNDASNLSMIIILSEREDASLDSDDSVEDSNRIQNESNLDELD